MIAARQDSTRPRRRSRKPGCFSGSKVTRDVTLALTKHILYPDAILREAQAILDVKLSCICQRIMQRRYAVRGQIRCDIDKSPRDWGWKRLSLSYRPVVIETFWVRMDQEGSDCTTRVGCQARLGITSFRVSSDKIISRSFKANSQTHSIMRIQ